LSDATVASAALPRSFQELLPGQARRITPDQLEQWVYQAKQLGAAMDQRRVVIGEGDKEPSGRELAAATSAVDLTLQKCQGMAGDWQLDLVTIREELPHLQMKVRGWLTLAAGVVTLLCVWMTAAQLNLFHSCSALVKRVGGEKQDA